MKCVLWAVPTVILGCGEFHECDDGIDNDGDGTFDLGDPGCRLRGTAEGPDPVIPECSDGIDNDGDGGIDELDPGCTGPGDNDEQNIWRPACTDGIDNDQDGLADFPEDPGCRSADDDDETDDCPGENCPACSDGQDNDGDGFVDYPADRGCQSAADDRELDECTTGSPLTHLPDSGVAGSTPGPSETNHFGADCENQLRPERAHNYLQTRSLMTLSFSTEGSSTNTILYVREGVCADRDREVACSSTSFSNETVTIENPVQGEYFVFVEDEDNGGGAYQLSVSGTLAAGATCSEGDTQFVCGAGTECHGVCTPTQCTNGIDDDGDGLADDLDPGCINADDDTESPDPSPLPACADGIDNDGDGDVDYPQDTGCTRASDQSEIDCHETDPIVPVTQDPESGDTTGAGNDFLPTCGSSGSAGDRVYEMFFPGDLDRLEVSTTGSSFDTVLSVLGDTCTGSPLGCNDDSDGTQSTVTLFNQTAGLYLFVVDGYSANEGEYKLTVRADIASGAACDPAHVAGGFAQCPDNETCVNGFCTAPACSDGADNDGDGLVDADDPGCEDDIDNDEADPMSPSACSDGIDNDGDGKVDFPEDQGCSQLGDTDEENCDIDASDILSVDAAQTTGDTSGGPDNHDTCGTNGPDHTFEIEFPGALDSLTVDTVGSAVNTKLSVLAPTCEDEVACNDNGGGAGTSLLSLTGLDAGTYFFVVDGDGAYTLNVSAAIAANEACDEAQVAAGIASCPVDQVCDQGFCVASICTNGLDDDGDGLADDFDPGCADDADSDEADPAIAPACADGVDNDGDGNVDFPADPGCARASDDDETSCTDTDPVLVINAATMTGDTANANDDFGPTCASAGSAGDHVYQITFPGDLTALSFDTFGTGFDSALTVSSGTCADQLQCNDDSGGTVQSEIDLGAAAAGTYFVIVDGYGSASGAYTLNTKATIQVGAACDDTQVTTGIATCDAGTVCLNNTCQ